MNTDKLIDVPVEDNNNSNIIVYDSLYMPDERPRRMEVCVSPVENVDGRVVVKSIDHDEEANKVFAFLQHWIACKTYDIIFRLMVENDDSHHYNRVEGVCVADLYDAHDSIHELERTIHVLERVEETWIPEPIRVMVENEIALLRNKVYSLASEDLGD